MPEEDEEETDWSATGQGTRSPDTSPATSLCGPLSPMPPSEALALKRELATLATTVLAGDQPSIDANQDTYGPIFTLKVGGRAPSLRLSGRWVPSSQMSAHPPVATQTSKVPIPEQTELQKQQVRLAEAVQALEENDDCREALHHLKSAARHFLQAAALTEDDRRANGFRERAFECHRLATTRLVAAEPLALEARAAAKESDFALPGEGRGAMRAWRASREALTRRVRALSASNVRI